MTDRELLELAAKAAGYHYTWHEQYECLEVWEDGWKNKKFWQPHRDDGDALRLAMQLGFTVEPGKCWHSPYGPAFGEDLLVGAYTATRRAIVRAAAEIGRQITEENKA